MEYRVKILSDWDSYDGIKIYVSGYNSDYKGYYFTIENGVFVAHPKEEGEKAKEPILTLTKFDRGFLEALVKGLQDFGLVAEPDKSLRISAEAINDERKEQIDWLRTQIEKQL